MRKKISIEKSCRDTRQSKIDSRGNNSSRNCTFARYDIIRIMINSKFIDLIDALVRCVGRTLIEIEGIVDLIENLFVRKFLQQATTLVTNLLHTRLLHLLVNGLTVLIDTLVRNLEKGLLDKF